MMRSSSSPNHSIISEEYKEESKEQRECLLKEYWRSRVRNEM